MIIRKMAVGNKEEAFIEGSFQNGLNIISSDDNNKGKTIVMQSMMYALGNEPTFPKTFEYKNYYHYIEFEANNVVYQLCRFNDGFILKNGIAIMLFDSVSEMKRYWNKNIFPIPKIIKNQIQKIVDPVLFLQLFFVGQDKKDTSNVGNSYYNKIDFYNMLFSLCDLNGLELNEEEIAQIKERLNVLKSEREVILKEHKILKSKKKSIQYLSSINDKLAFGKRVSELEKINSKIAELRKSRNIAATRKATWETTMKELRSLNRTLECGELRCMDCNSTNIAFSASRQNAFAFDVSSVEMRNEIIASINEKIEAYTEEIDSISAQITTAQNDLQSIMQDDSITIEALVAYKQEIFSATDAENRIKEINTEIEDLNNRLIASNGTTQSNKEGQQALMSALLNEMNSVRAKVDPSGNTIFDDIFTKKDEVYSGSEATIFHLARIYAFCKVLEHNYPILIDSFRAEDLSTAKEELVLSIYKELPNQIVFSTTLKEEELGKYDNRTDIHHIDYATHSPSKMLSSDYRNEFYSIMNSISINLSD